MLGLGCPSRVPLGGEKEDYILQLFFQKLCPWDEVRQMALSTKGFRSSIVPPPNHLVQKEIISLHPHFTHDSLIASKPCVGLLCDRRVEPPFLFICYKVWVCSWIAPCRAEYVSLLVLGLAVKDIHGKGAVGKVLPIPGG